MSAIDIHGQASSNGSQPLNHVDSTDQVEVTSYSYAQLIDFHLQRRAVNEDGNQRPQQSLDNERSIIEDWLTRNGLGESDLVGEELGVRFDRCLNDYLSAVENDGLAASTVRDRKTIVKKLLESFEELRRTDGLPEDFGGALKELITTAGITISDLSSKTEISEYALRSWMSGRIPNPNSLPRIRRLERALNVSPGTLSSRIPHAHWSKKPIRCGTTPWRQNQIVVRRLTYYLPTLTAELQEEWGELLLFFTDSCWASEHGYKRNSEWRIRWNNNRCATADIVFKFLRGFFGFLCLPVTATDKRITGLGFRKEGLTLGLLTDASLIIKYLYFLKARTVSDSFNLATVRVLSLCTTLLREATGYLRQRPEFGAKLPTPVAETDWQMWCEDNRLILLNFKAEITSSKPRANELQGKVTPTSEKVNQTNKSDRVRRTRNPFEAVMDIIRERQHPITALFDLADRLESLTPMLERGSKVVLATHSQSIFQVRLISSNPLRVENFSMMTYKPADRASFDRACDLYRRYKARERKFNPVELFVETTDDSNLYQRRDGTWRLRFNDRDFKNEKGVDLELGVMDAQYDVQVVPSVYPALAEYIFRHRPVLNEALINALQAANARRALAALTPEEELAILHCPYVFRPAPSAASALGMDKLRARAQVSTHTLSYRIFNLTSRYLPESKGFGAHACRHLVATEYIKNHPDGWEVAAVALHNSVQIVKKHYSWVEVGDLIKPWNSYHEQIRQRHDKGEI